MNKNDNQGISTKSTYRITFLLGLAFSITLMQSTWKTAIERKQKDFHFEILSIQQSVTNNVLTGNDVTNNVASLISSNNDILLNQFDTFANDILDRYEHIEAINYYPLTKNNANSEFRLRYESSRNKKRINVGDDVYVNKKYIDAINTSIISNAVVPAPPDLESDPDRKYWLFKAIYNHDDSLLDGKNKSMAKVKGLVSVLVSPTKLLGNKGEGSSLTITIFSDTSNLYGRQLLYFNDPDLKGSEKLWKVDKLTEEKLIQLPPYSIKIIIEKNLYFSELEYHLLLVALLISVGIIMMLYGLVRAKVQQEEELKTRNAVIEQQVEKQTKELAIARDEALEAVRMKSEFLASMSHEIRTPLNAIIGMSDLMSETKLTNEQGRYVSVFKKAGDALLSLVNDILDLSKIEADQLVLEAIPFNVLELIEEVAEIYALKASDKNIEIIPRIDAGVNIYRIGDPGRLKQIILNLISNALKFTDKGEIVVALSNENDTEDNNQLLISVSDTGIGIPKTKLEAIFASFTQADTSTTRRYGGTGLGLTITKRLTEMMGGKIWVESEEDKGSCFFVRVSLQEQTQHSTIKRDFNNNNIMIVDSRMNNCLSIEEQLLASGAICFKANSIEEANEILNHKTTPEVMLIDSRQMFSDDEINISLNEDVTFDNIILLVNPKDMSKHSVLAKKSGIKHLLLKPIKRKELFKEVNKVINNKDESLINNVEQIEKKEEVKAKHILLVEDNPDNRLLIKAYLKKTPHSLDEAENGSVAVDMYKQGSYDLVFMDVQMPVMDGHEATRLIRSWEKEQKMSPAKIVSLTAHAIKEEIDKCIDAGCDTHLSKPIKKSTLLQTIEELS
ncbi:MAG TPA: response regulator [Thiotrichaceae bacterium]|nr:response regulator [Thiotrichaceae bacterium]HIM08769.1 response regulator [Gammaproteobacteria bacterium]